MSLSNEDRAYIREVIIETVNGKIEILSEKVEAHMDEVQPFLDGWRGARTIGNTVKWLSGVIIAIGASVALFIKYF